MDITAYKQITFYKRNEVFEKKLAIKLCEKLVIIRHLKNQVFICNILEYS